MESMDDWITTEEAADIAGYHPNHVRRLMRRGVIRGKKFNTAWMISKESLLAYLEKAKQSGEKRGPKTED